MDARHLGPFARVVLRARTRRTFMRGALLRPDTSLRFLKRWRRDRWSGFGPRLVYTIEALLNPLTFVFYEDFQKINSDMELICGRNHSMSSVPCSCSESGRKYHSPDNRKNARTLAGLEPAALRFTGTTKPLHHDAP